MQSRCFCPPETLAPPCLNNGRVDAAGTHAELMEQSPIYREVYESQIKGGNGNDAA